MPYRELNLDEVGEVVKVKLKELPSGERRYQLRYVSGLSCSITVAAPRGGWQRAHRHVRVDETRIVQSGWCALATLSPSGLLRVVRYGSGSIFTVQRGVAHCVYLAGGATVVAAKHGSDTDLTKDWISEPHLDSLCDGLAEQYFAHTNHDG